MANSISSVPLPPHQMPEELKARIAANQQPPQQPKAAPPPPQPPPVVDQAAPPPQPSPQAMVHGGAVNPESTTPPSELKFPSRGLFYAHHSPTFLMRPIEFMEEAILNTGRLVQSGQAVDMVIRNCMVSPKMDIDDILAMDHFYIMLALRRMSFGDNYKFDVECQSATCRKVYEDEIDLSRLPVNMLPEEFTSEDMQIVLPQTGHVIKFRLLTRGDYKKIEEINVARAKNKATQHNAPDESFFDRVIFRIVTINGREMERHAIRQLLAHLPTKDSEVLRDKMEELELSVDTEIISTCRICGHVNDLMMPISDHFFRHTRRKRSGTKL